MLGGGGGGHSAHLPRLIRLCFCNPRRVEVDPTLAGDMTVVKSSSLIKGQQYEDMIIVSMTMIIEHSISWKWYFNLR